MRLADPCLEPSSVAMPAVSSLSDVAVTDVSPEEVRSMMLYLRKARDRAILIRERSPAGSYLESVLSRTIDGIALELSHLEYLLALKPASEAASTKTARRMRPTI
ncbi:hypothetical protein [Roseibium aggregatum]|uniref:Uncharacterized protein n=1 Tax=Roseibium aggregatum TaxID=187304 RepID=A0A939J3E1_9HYPH|nr:hypothetical protein [Roseibium aggregatum]MBN9669569.1 hypothetical protein [Roseibium aggregatum]